VVGPITASEKPRPRLPTNVEARVLKIGDGLAQDRQHQVLSGASHRAASSYYFLLLVRVKQLAGWWGLCLVCPGLNPVQLRDV